MTPLISSTWQRQQKRIAMQFIEEKPPWSNNLCCWLTITIFSWTLTNDHCDIPNYLFLLTREYRAGQLRLPKNRACEGASDILTFWKHRDCFKFCWICTICADIVKQMMWLIRRGFAFCGAERISPDETSGKVFLFALGLRLGKLEGLGCHI